MNKEIELILDSTHDAMIAVDKDSVVTIFNKAAGLLTKVDPETAVGRRVEDVVANTRLPHILNTGNLELNQTQTLGDINIITNRMPVLNDKGEIIGAIAVFRDISEVQALAEEIASLTENRSTLEAIFNATQDAISVVDQNGINVLINPAYTKLTGYTRRDVIGKYCTTDLAEGESVHLKVLQTKGSIRGKRLRVGPSKRDVVVDAAPIIVNDELRGSVAVIHDLTEINKLSSDLAQAKQIIRSLEAKYTFDDIIGSSVPMVATVEKAKLAAVTPATVILRGESGTGKELFAHAIHNASSRKYSQFVRVNCAAISESILESELFGYEEGAFTGAVKGGRVGLFEKADGGTLFLDEIGEISMNMQAKLLRVLQEKEIVRVGGTKSIPVDVRVISATNVNLEKAIEDGRFRQDLYYRLNVFPIQIPSLRERKSDLQELIVFMIIRFNQEYGRNVSELDQEALNVISRYDWPGNVRELENFIGRAMINMKMSETVILTEHLPIILKDVPVEKPLVLDFSPEVLDNNVHHYADLEKAVDDFEKAFIMKSLEENSGNREKTSRELGVSLRNLYYKLKKYGLQ